MAAIARSPKWMLRLLFGKPTTASVPRAGYQQAGGDCRLIENPALQVVDVTSMPTPEPRSGGFLYFKPPATNGIKFVHKINRGQIDLRFAKMGTQVRKVKELFEKHIRPDKMKIVKTHKSAAIRTSVEPLVSLDDFDEQKEKVTSCIIEAKALLQWWIEHRQAWQAANAVV